jgi:hypothetical protein
MSFMRAYSLSNIKFFHLGAFTLLCPKGPGYSVKNNSVVGKEYILGESELFTWILELTCFLFRC